jgi:hypothetical protein
LDHILASAIGAVAILTVALLRRPPRKRRKKGKHKNDAGNLSLLVASQGFVINLSAITALAVIAFLAYVR